MPAACLIVCEKTPRWAVALRDALGGEPHLIQTRSLPAVESALADSPASLVAMEITPANLEPAVHLLERMSRCFPLARAVALLPYEMSDAALILREAGAIGVIHWTWEAPQAARIARRQLALAPPEQLGFRDWVFQRLPWSTYAKPPAPNAKR